LHVSSDTQLTRTQSSADACCASAGPQRRTGRLVVVGRSPRCGSLAGGRPSEKLIERLQTGRARGIGLSKASWLDTGAGVC
jgi:hypothetical protein